MSENNQACIDKFVEMAKAVACHVTEVSSTADILNYVVDLCEKKAPCELLVDEPGTATGPLGPNRCPTRVQRIVAAPQLSDDDFASLKALCDEKGFLCIRDNLRKYAAGIDVGLSEAMLGVAASGTCMCDTTSEDWRLAGMISECAVMIVKKSQIYPDLPSIAGFMREQMGKGPEGTFTSLITGPSRTADIECVGAVGVHGPLEMHLLLVEG